MKMIQNPCMHDYQQCDDTSIQNNLDQLAVNEARILTVATSLDSYAAEQSVLVCPVLSAQLYTVYDRIS